MLLKQNSNIIEIKNLKNYFDKIVDVILIIDKTREINTKNNEKMMFVTASDELSQITVVLFPKIYQKTNIQVGDIIKVNGRVEKRFDQYQIVANKITKLN